MRIRSWSRFRNGLGDNWLPPPKLDRSSCSLGSTLLLWMRRCFEVKYILDMSLPICPVPHRRGSWKWYPKSKSRKYNIHTHFPKDPNCEVCLRTKMTRAPCTRRTSEALPRAEKFGALITADHKVLNEGGESRDNHRYAVVAQDLATQWILIRAEQKLLRRRERGRESFSSRHTNESHVHWKFIGIWQILWRSIMESSNLNTASIRDEWHCWKSRKRSERRNFSSIATIRIGWKMVGWFYGVLLLSAESPRPLGRGEISVWKAIWWTIQRANNSLWSNGSISSDFNVRFIKTWSIWQESITWHLSWIWLHRGENLERRYSDCGLGRFGKDGCIRNLSSLNQRERSIDNTKKIFIHFPCGRWYSKIVRKRPRIPRTHSEQGESQFYICEDHEAVIKLIVKGRSPTMRHVSRTHRVALDWLFDRINLEPKIQIKYVDAKNQPTCWHSNQRGSCAWRVESSSPFVFNIMSFSMSSCSHFSSFLPDRKAKRHVKERLRSDFQWRFTDCKAKTNGSSEGEICQLGVTQPAHQWSAIQRRRKWVSRRIVYSLLTYCSEMSVFGSWYFVVCE